MTPELWQRLKPLYEAALDMSKEERAHFIAKACKDDTYLKRELEELLESTTERTFPLDSPLIRLGKLFQENHTTLSDGQVLLGRFRIVRHLGSGGMGDVYEAVDLHLQMGRIALKVIRSSIAQNQAILARFKEEVILARRISDPNVCRIHEFFVPLEQAESECVAFLTMEFLEGTTLSDRIEAGLIPLKGASAIAVQLCSALQSIHGSGVIHRDLKPRNIMLVPHNGAEKVVVMDFGLAHAVSNKSLTEELRNTLPGMIMGTPEYMAPEQFEGREVTAATDIYALGLVLYELVTGRRLYAASTPFAAAVRRGRRPDAPSSMRRGIPAAWDDVIAKCLEFDAERRYQTVSEVIDALNQHKLVIWRFQQGQRISLTRRSLIAIASATVLALGIIGWFLLDNAFSYHMSPEVQEWYKKGADDLRDGTYFKATKAFGMAVQLDPNYPLSHARLAEAWAELEFTEKAQEQILQAEAPEQQKSLSKLERRYIDAVRTTLLGDYPAAVQDYEAIQKRLPKSEQPEGLVDLGRAYEKAGRMKEALDDYNKAVQLRPNNPTPLVHLGILKSRLRDPSGADAAFGQAEKLYKAGSNQEGIDEVIFQRGYAANERGEFDQATVFLGSVLSNPILNDDEKADNIRLRVRSLLQLSSIEYNLTTAKDKSNDKKAIDYANQAMQLAVENGLQYWYTDSLMRLGNAYLDEEDDTKAEASLLQALQLAQKNKYLRLEAFVNLTLASLYDQQGKRTEQISYAQAAIKYFAKFNFMDQVDDASTLIIRGQQEAGNLAEALKSANELLRLAEKANDKLYIEQAEETVGGVLMNQEQYPFALTHFEAALKESRDVRDKEAYQALHCANALWRLGRYDEAQGMLNSISAESKNRKDIASSIANTQAQMQLSRGQYRGALAIAKQALHSPQDLPDGTIADFEAVSARAEAQLGQLPQASQEAEKLQNLARKNNNEGMMASAQLVYAEVALRSNMPAKALPMAEAANRYFARKELRESEWLSLLFASEAARDSGDLKECSKKAKQALDILNDIEHTWGSSIYRQYCGRLDIKVELQEFSEPKKAKRSSRQ